MSVTSKAIVIGGGIGGLGTACLLGKAGYEVTLYEKNEQLGGRASVFEAEGFRFDMGPSWYLMPDLFAQFFELLGERIEDHLELTKLDPSYRIFFQGRTEPIDIFSDLERNRPLFEEFEPGSTEKLKAYLKTAGEQYRIAKEQFIYKNYDSIFDFFTWDVLTKGRKLHVFQSMDRYVRSQFESEELQKILQYTLVFLGSSPYNTPALYNIMSYIDFDMGVFYPKGGIYALIQALERIARKNGVTIKLNEPVQEILIAQGRAIGIKRSDGTTDNADVVISNADYHFTEQVLLPPAAREHDEEYWKKKTLAPSAFILYLGIDGRIPTLQHHNLIFSQDWKQNFADIFETPRLPEDPSYYVCAPSVTDPTVARAGTENLFVLVPIPAKLTFASTEQEQYKQKILDSLEKTLHIPGLRKRILYERTFWAEDFEERYHSFGGTALGLAHTLTQTAIFRPNNISKKVKGLYFVGGNTNPGIGMPMCFVSAELVYKRLTHDRSAGPLQKL